MDPVDKKVGERVRLLRLERDMSQTQVADALGLTFQQIQKYERGANRISASKLIAFSKLFNVPVEALFEDVDYPGNVVGKRAARRRESMGAKHFSSPMADPQAMKLAREFSGIDDSNLRNRIIHLVREIAQIPA